MELNGASAIITGGASGIGEATARRLSALGARCVIVDLDESKGKELATALRREFAKADVSNTDEVQAAVDAAMAKTDPVDPEGQRGVIVNMASAAAFDGQTGQAAYSASKGGVVGMTLPIARDLRAIGVRVNTVAPGLIDTPIYGEGEGSEKFKAHLAQNVLFPKRLGYAEEIASMVVELVTNDYMNAEIVRVDGGVRLPPK